MSPEAPKPYEEARMENEVIKKKAEELITQFTVALRQIPELQGTFKVLDEPLATDDPIKLIDQLAQKPFTDYGFFHHNGTSYSFEGLGNPHVLQLSGCPQIPDTVKTFEEAEEPRDGDHPFLSLRTAFPYPRILWINNPVANGVWGPMEEFENTPTAVKKAEELLMSFQPQSAP